MDDNLKALLLALGTFALIIIGGVFFVDNLIPLGYVESSIIYLAGVIGAGLFWLGRK